MCQSYRMGSGSVCVCKGSESPVSSINVGFSYRLLSFRLLPPIRDALASRAKQRDDDFMKEMLAEDDAKRRQQHEHHNAAASPPVGSQ